MIRKLLRRVFGDGRSNVAHTKLPLTIPFKTHGIAREHIEPCALKTISALQEAGYVAFVVGGAVRDLALGKHPKDYDVATDAMPEEVRRLFRRSRIIGRRFRLVHVMCGNETIEVSTFRGDGSAPLDIEADEEESGEHRAAESGRILRDNVFGTQEQDAKRRDFTMNALYYDPRTQEIWDYCAGYRDLKAGILRVIGDAEQRYREDPVRMLRAVRLGAKLDFRLDEATRTPISRLAPLLKEVPSARLFDEMLKLLFSGHALNSVRQLRAEGLHHGLLPMLDVVLEQPLGERFINAALKNTDDRVQQDKPVSPAFLFATLLWHDVLSTWQQCQSTGTKAQPALHEAMEQVLHNQAEQIAIPRRYGANMKEIWSMQPRFQARSGYRPYKLLQHPRFRAAYDFLLLRAQSGEVDAELGQWWEVFQHASEEDREQMLVADSAPKKRPRRKRKAPNNSAEAVSNNADSPEE